MISERGVGVTHQETTLQDPWSYKNLKDKGCSHICRLTVPDRLLGQASSTAPGTLLANERSAARVVIQEIAWAKDQPLITAVS